MRVFAFGIHIAMSIFVSPQIHAGDKPKVITTADMRELAAIELKEAEKSLNIVFFKLISRLDNRKQIDLLTSSQQSWLVSREKTAKFAASFYDGGSIQPQIYTISLTVATKARTAELQYFLDTEFDH